MGNRETETEHQLRHLAAAAKNFLGILGRQLKNLPETIGSGIQGGKAFVSGDLKQGLSDVGAFLREVMQKDIQRTRDYFRKQFRQDVEDAWELLCESCFRGMEVVRNFVAGKPSWVKQYLAREWVLMMGAGLILALVVQGTWHARYQETPAELKFQDVTSHKAVAVMEDEIPVYATGEDAMEDEDGEPIGTLKYGKKARVSASSVSLYRIQYKGEEAYIKQSGTVLYNYKKKHIALTFDDGPSIYTPKILKALKKYHCRATFFVLGNRIGEDTKKTLLEEVALGCEIGNHSYDHAYLPGKKKKKITKEFWRTDRRVYRIIGKEPELARSPYGAYNKKILKIMDRPQIYWTLDTEDWKYQSRKHLLGYVKKHMKDGTIVLMHDIQPTTADAADRLCEYLTHKNYEMVTVSELAAIKGVKLKKGKTYLTFESKKIKKGKHQR